MSEGLTGAVSGGMQECMRYAQGGGLTAEGRRRREQVRLEAVERFGQRVPAAEIAAELRVTERSVRRWRQAWQAGGLAGLASRGQAARCLLDEAQLAELETVLEAGPLAAGCGTSGGRWPGSATWWPGGSGCSTPCRGSGTCCAAAAGPPRWARAGPSNATTAPSRCGRRRPGPG